MPFRSFEFGDSIKNTKSLPTAQSPRWYQLKTASFRVGTSHAPVFFFFFPSFFFAVMATALSCICATLQPLSQVRKQLAFHPTAPFLPPWASLSSGWMQLQWQLSTVSVHVIGWEWAVLPGLPLTESLMESLPLCCCGCRLPLWVIRQISQWDPSRYSKYSLIITSEELDYSQSV